MTEALDRFRLIHHHAIARVGVRGHADRWGLGAEALAVTVHESVSAWARGLDAKPAASAIDTYLDGLNAEDLVLACACRAGIAAAWEHFVGQYRAGLRAAARALLHDDIRAADLADSLYAELYGLEERYGQRRSLLSYFHGRSTLRTWLKTIIAQRVVDEFRTHRRAGEIAAAAAREQIIETSMADDPPDPDRARYVEALGDAIAKALAELKPRDRIRLNFYHLEELTLKEIGGIMGEYESSVSRRLTRTRLNVRRRVEQVLRREKDLSGEQIRLCYAYALEAWPADLSRTLLAAIK
ncbi:MAG TPA: sigma-70 family RNA polymerase sigma factor [Candidatus Binataceae bacterium]|jgi:RNA polymerase sigma-70 factor|nr:sigma-70 family RNA polymerase sigma factor [Candidatus Binataceae bacterium]